MISRRALLAAVVPAAGADLLVWRGGRLVIDQWRGGAGMLETPGSLWKPFLACAIASPEPAHCRGEGCWRRHGKIQIVDAVAHSCNAWFNAQRWHPGRLTEFGLRAGEGHWSSWPARPLELLLAFAELMARRADYPFVAAGLRDAALRGTASALGAGFLAKTGTAKSARFAGDGWVLAAWRESVALYRENGVPGAVAARSLRARIERERL